MTLKLSKNLLLPEQVGQKVMIIFFVVYLHFPQIPMQLSVSAGAGLADMLW